MRWERALLPYPGGKRWARPGIFGLIASAYDQASWPTLVFCDAFMGGGAVALGAKALGFRLVLANDIAIRCAIVGRALLENSRVTLTEHDVLMLFDPPPSAPARSSVILQRLPSAVAPFFARAWPLAKTYPPPKDDLVRLLLIKALLSYFPLSLPSATDSWRIPEGDFDYLTGQRLRHYLSRGRGMLHPSYLLKLAKQVNAGVFPGAARMYQKDVFDFLSLIEAHVAYVDPPFGGSQSYEGAFRLLDEFIGDDRPQVSSFSSRRPPLDDLLDACKHIPVVVISLGNALLDEGGVRALVARHRQVRRVLSLPHHHYGALASTRKKAINREFLALATL